MARPKIETMFTGLIETLGTIQTVTPTDGATRITLQAPVSLTSRLKEGDSVAVSGVCLTALDIAEGVFSADLATETIARTSLSRLAPGHIVNLELPTPAGTPLGGHIVQGHVDATGTLLELTPLHPATPEHSDWRLRIRVPVALTRFIVEKGSITIEGISLTVAAIEVDVVTVAIIPHTYGATNLHALKAGAEVNLETDVLARYAEQMRLQSLAATGTLTEAGLIARGY